MDDESLVNDLSFRVHHTMLPVADLDRSVSFYTRLLGMKVKERHASEARKVEVGLVGYGDEASAPFLELIQDTSERAPTQVTPANIHIGIDTSDLRKLCDSPGKGRRHVHAPAQAAVRRYGSERLDPRSRRP